MTKQKNNVFLIFGEDLHKVTEKAKEIINDLMPEKERLTGLEVIDGAVDLKDDAIGAVQKVFRALNSIGLFGDRKVVWLKDATFLSDNKVGKLEDVKESVNKLAAMIKDGLHPETVLVVTSSAVDGRYAFHKACTAAGEVHKFELAVKDDDVGEVVLAGLAQEGVRMTDEALDKFIERTGNVTGIIISELEKLFVYISGRKEITLADVELMTSSVREREVWDICDGVGEKNISKSLRILQHLLFQGENEVGIIIAVESRFKDLLLYREAIERGWLRKAFKYGRNTYEWGQVSPDDDKVFASLDKDPRKAHPFRVSILADQASKFTMRELRRCLDESIKAHETIVSSGLPKKYAHIALETAIVKMLGGKK